MNVKEMKAVLERLPDDTKIKAGAIDEAFGIKEATIETNMKTGDLALILWAESKPTDGDFEPHPGW